MFQKYRCFSLLGYTDYALLVFHQIAEETKQLIYYEIRLDSLNVPGNCLLKKTMTQKWEPSAEKMYVRDGVLKEDANMALLLEGGGLYRCDFKTTYK